MRNNVSGVDPVSPSDFREFAFKGDVGKAERLFRAAVSAFCSLTRPSRRDAVQLDDLTLPLFDMVSRDTRRYVAAALSECAIAPVELVRRLSAEPVEVCAPLLVRSRVLGDVDLVALISKHGLPHARAIARRPDLNVAILHLVRAMEGTVSVHSVSPSEDAATMSDSNPASSPSPMRGDDIRHRLRAMMRAGFGDDDATTIRSVAAPACFAKLRDTALTGNSTFFQTALADALGLNFRTARSITETTSYSALLAALRALELAEEQAFLIASAVFPRQFPHPEAIRLFLDRYRALPHDAAMERVRGWKVDMVSAWIDENAHPARAGNSDRAESRDAASRLRA